MPCACRVLLEHLGFTDTLEPLPAGPTPEASLDAAAASLAGTSLDDGGQPGADHGSGEAAEGLESRDDADFFDQHQGVLTFIFADVGSGSGAATMLAARTTVTDHLPANPHLSLKLCPAADCRALPAGNTHTHTHTLLL